MHPHPEMAKWASRAGPARARLGTARLRHGPNGPSTVTGRAVPARVPSPRPMARPVGDRAVPGRPGHDFGPTARRAEIDKKI